MPNYRIRCQDRLRDLLGAPPCPHPLLGGPQGPRLFPVGWTRAVLPWAVGDGRWGTGARGTRRQDRAGIPSRREHPTRKERGGHGQASSPLASQPGSPPQGFAQTSECCPAPAEGPLSVSQRVLASGGHHTGSQSDQGEPGAAGWVRPRKGPGSGTRRGGRSEAALGRVPSGSVIPEWICRL